MKKIFTNMNYPERRSIRLSGFNYSQNGWYFVTLCTHDRECLFGDIKPTRIIPNNNDKLFLSRMDANNMVLNELGNIVQNIWQSLPKHHPVSLDAFQIMPNHVHFVIVIVGVYHVGVGRDRPAPNPETTTKTPGIPTGASDEIPTGASGEIPTGASRRAPTLGFIVGQFKSETAKQIRLIKSNNIFFKVWQRNYPPANAYKYGQVYVWG